MVEDDGMHASSSACSAHVGVALAIGVGVAVGQAGVEIGVAEKRRRTRGPYVEDIHVAGLAQFAACCGAEHG